MKDKNSAGASHLYLGVRCLPAAFKHENPLRLMFLGLEARRPHTPDTQMEAKCFIWCDKSHWASTGCKYYSWLL